MHMRLGKMSSCCVPLQDIEPNLEQLREATIKATGWTLRRSIWTGSSTL